MKNVIEKVRGGGRRWPVPREDLTALRDWAARPPIGLRLDVDRLDEAEQHELVELQRTTFVQGGGVNLNQLSPGERRKLEALIEKAADRPGHFENVRTEAEMKEKFAVLAERSHRPPRRPRYEEEGSIRIPQQVFQHLDRPDPAFLIGELGLLAFLQLQLENGKALVPGGRIEGAGDDAVLVIDGNLGVGARFDPEDRLNWRRDLDHLARNQWFRVERSGQEVRVSRGSRALRAAKAAAG
jgi:hypothetical protein